MLLDIASLTHLHEVCGLTSIIIKGLASLFLQKPTDRLQIKQCICTISIQIVSVINNSNRFVINLL